MKLSRLHLVRISRESRPEGAAHYGDSCPQCRGDVGVYCTRHSGQRTIRYLACRACGWKPPDSKLVTSDPPSESPRPGLSQLVLWQ